MTFNKSAAKGIGKVLGTIGAVGGITYLANKYRNQLKTVIAKKIASLGQLYHRWMEKASKSRDSGFAAKIKKNVC